VAAGIRSVGLNALFLDPGETGGPETYLRGLVPALTRQAPHVAFSLVTTRRGAARLRVEGWHEWLEVIALAADEGERARRLLAEQVVLPRLAARRGWDLVHSLASTAPLRRPVPSVITLHDVTFLRFRTFSHVTTLALRFTVVPPARRADWLIAVSSAARDEAITQLGLDPERFTVVPNGAGRPQLGAADLHTVRSKYDLADRRIVLSVGAKRPHKNQALLVRASASLPEDVVVVLAGRPEAYDAELRRLADRLDVDERLRFVDYVSDEDLEALWRLASAAAFPTRAEGFGLPVLEAMARGVPVACSDIPVLREVGGDLPHYFDPDDPASAAMAIGRALGDLRADALRTRAAGFSWDRAAAETLGVYERAVARTRS
jgi:glycosyltransferase involved in cell wall biosynthesis